MNRFGKAAAVLALFALTISAAQSDETAVDHAKLHVGGISKDAPIVVHAFDITGADLGKFKHQDTAKRSAQTAPHLLAVDIVDTLRGHGFSNITLSESAELTGEALHLVGNFTEINPGSQATRAWIGFGAGASKVCISGTLQTTAGEVVGEFEDCEKGLGWGDSSAQTSGESSRIGANIGELLLAWTATP
jgi:hypothetical protein